MRRGIEIALLVLAVCGCTEDDTKPAGARAYDRTFVRQALSAGMFEVESAKLVIGADEVPAEVQGLARDVIDSYEDANRKLEGAAVRAGIETPTEMSSADMSKMLELEHAKGTNLATTYFRLQAATHDGVVDMFGQCAARCETTELAKYAAENEAVWTEHEETFSALVE